MRGERAAVSRVRGVSTGSSPHARGTQHDTKKLQSITRFIPACAGNAWDGIDKNGESTVHPRMRGERSAPFCELVAIVGSSPHARGTRRVWNQRMSLKRFIPACAGNAHRYSAGRSVYPVHPRMRGERCRRSSFTPPASGSSPHARGTLPLKTTVGPDKRFIPACAGNATTEFCSFAMTAVHPRMRGERRQMIPNNARPDGSSPHARGTPTYKGQPGGIWRFIPACAGNALPH